LKRERLIALLVFLGIKSPGISDVTSKPNDPESKNNCRDEKAEDAKGASIHTGASSKKDLTNKIDIARANSALGRTAV
jgi:hypothetical protein